MVLLCGVAGCCAIARAGGEESGAPIGLPVFASGLGAPDGRDASEPETQPPDRAPAVDAPGDADGSAAPPPAEPAVPDDVYRELAMLSEAVLLIRRHYVDEKSFADILQGALHGMLQALDPHSAFLDATAFSAMRDDVAGTFTGIGIQIGVRNGTLLIVAPIEDSPAFHAGLQAGDRITGIDGERTANWPLDRAVGRLRGERGTSVTLTIDRDAVDAFDVTVRREEVRVESVRGVCLLEPGIGYLRLAQFNDPAPAALDAALNTLSDQGMQALVLDLRNNPGGLMSVAQAVAERFLPRGAKIVSMRGRDGVTPLDSVRATRRDGFTRLPLAVLINRGSASASEIVAGALRDNRRAVVVGERSFGKASVQNVVGLQSEPGSAVRLTTAFYYTPSGRLIHGEGIEPDVVVPLSATAWRDVQIRRLAREAPGARRKDNHDGPVVDAEDRPLVRAVELLRAARVFLPEGT